MTELALPALDGTSAHGWLATMGLARLLTEQWPDISLRWGDGGWTHPVLTGGPATVQEAAGAALAPSLSRVPRGGVLPDVDPEYPPKRTRPGTAPGQLWTGPAGALWQHALVTPLGDLHPLMRPHAAQTLRGMLSKMVGALTPTLLLQALTGLGMVRNYQAGLWVLRSDAEGRVAASPGRDWLMVMGLPWAPVEQVDGPGGVPRATAPGWRWHPEGDRAETFTWRLWTEPVLARHLAGMDLGFAGGPECVAYRLRRTSRTRFAPPTLHTDRAPRRLGRPPIGPRVHVNLSSQDIQWLDNIVEERAREGEYTTRAAVVREIISEVRRASGRDEAAVSR